MVLKSRQDAFKLLEQLGAPEHLLIHATLVGEAADLILEKFNDLNITIDCEFVRMGVVLHDVGKIIHSHEMSGPGSDHESEGEAMLLGHGVSPELARCCMSHARWQDMECSFEELVIAVSDKLWKGKRVDSLELFIIDRIAKNLGLERWEIYEILDTTFENIAANGDDRLNRSIIN